MHSFGDDNKQAYLGSISSMAGVQGHVKSGKGDVKRWAW